MDDGPANQSDIRREAPASVSSVEPGDVEYREAVGAPNETRRLLDIVGGSVVAPVVIAAVGAILFIVNLGGYPLYTKGEPREAVTVLDIAAAHSIGGVILPLRAGVEIPSKPLLMHWMAAIISTPFGVNEWTVRIPSAALAILGMLACWYYVRALFDSRAAILAALILGTTLQYLQAGSGARVDTTLTFFLEIAFFEFVAMAEGASRRRWLFFIALAMAVLAKGPVGVVLPIAVAGAWIVIQRRWRLLNEIDWVRGGVIVLAVAGSWYIAAAVVGGRAFIEKQVLSENFVRFLGASEFHEGHVHPFYYVELSLIAGFMPWTPVLALAAYRAIRAPRALDSRMAYLLVWIGVVLVFYSVAKSKRGVYLLALYPALATMLALYLADEIRAPIVPRLSQWLTHISAVVAGLVALVAMISIAMLWLSPSAFGAILYATGIHADGLAGALRSVGMIHISSVVVMTIAAAALAVALWRIRSEAQAMTCGIVGVMLIVVSAANIVVVPAIAQTLSLKDFASDVLKITEGRSLGYLGMLDYDVAFYTRRTIPIISSISHDAPDYLICFQESWEKNAAADRLGYETILTSNPTDLDGSGRMILLKRVSA